MNRTESLEITFKHPFLKKGFIKLKKEEIDFCYDFITKNSDTNPDEFEYRLNRFFLDIELKPKNWKIILELLSCSNTFYKNQKG